MSEERDRAMALAAVIEAFGVKDFTPVRVNVYLDNLKDISVPLLNAAVRLAIQTRTWFPKVAELRADAERCRRELLEAHPYERCSACNGFGKVRVFRDGEKPRYANCRCWEQYQARMADLGVTERPIALLEARPSVDVEEALVTVEDFPPAISDRLHAIACGKVLR